MINTYSTEAQVLASGDNVVFYTNGIAKGCSAKHLPGDASIYITIPGYYFVTFNATAKANDVATATEDSVSLQLFNNGVAVPGASASIATSEDELKESYSFSTIVKVLPSCPAVDNNAVLTVSNVGLGSVVNVANMTVIKI